MKKDAQRRRKERKEREIKEKEKHRKYSLGQHESSLSKTLEKPEKPIEPSLSPSLRRGSVCHVEQRLMERHERILARQDRLAKKETDIKRRRLSSTDSDQGQSSRSKSNSLQVPRERSRSITPNRRNKSASPSPFTSDGSQSSSMESVLGSIENIDKDNRNNQKTRKT